MKFHRGPNQRIEKKKRPGPDADEQHLQHSKNIGHEKFTEMEPGRGGNIEVQVEMVNGVKTPKKWNGVIGPMPEEKRVIEKKKTKHAFRPTRFYPSEKSPLALPGEGRGPQNGRVEKQAGQERT